MALTASLDANSPSLSREQYLPYDRSRRFEITFGSCSLHSSAIDSTTQTVAWADVSLTLSLCVILRILTPNLPSAYLVYHRCPRLTAIGFESNLCFADHVEPDGLMFGRRAWTNTGFGVLQPPSSMHPGWSSSSLAVAPFLRRVFGVLSVSSSCPSLLQAQARTEAHRQ